jgi:renalase
MTDRECLVVGAGMSGLMAAHALQSAGWKVTVLDKSRGVGGRMATRRIDDARFDHGAQFFTVRDPRFAEFVKQWQSAGVVTQWSTGFPTPDNLDYQNGHPRYRGVPGMTAVAKHLVLNLDVRLSTRVQVVAVESQHWRVTAEDGTQFSAPHLLLSMPVPQALMLLAAGAVQLPPQTLRDLETIEYDPCFAVMVVLDGPSNIPAPGAVQIDGEPIRWIADNLQKGVSEGVCAVTIHAGASFTRQYFDTDPDIVAQKLIAAAQDWLGSPVRHYQVQRWRYSQPLDPHPERFVSADLPPFVAFTGDAFGASRVEGAALSGLAVAEALQTR